MANTGLGAKAKLATGNSGLEIPIVIQHHFLQPAQETDVEEGCWSEFWRFACVVGAEPTDTGMSAARRMVPEEASEVAMPTTKA